MVVCSLYKLPEDECIVPYAAPPPRFGRSIFRTVGKEKERTMVEEKDGGGGVGAGDGMEPVCREFS